MEKLEKLENFINARLTTLERGIVATPDMKFLEMFAKANHGSNDYLLMQMAIQVGYKMALEDVAEVAEIDNIPLTK